MADWNVGRVVLCCLAVHFCVVSGVKEIEVGHGTKAKRDETHLDFVCNFTGPKTVVVRWTYQNDTTSNPDLLGVVGENKGKEGRMTWSHSGNMVSSTYNFSRKGVSSDAGIYSCVFVDQPLNKTLNTTQFFVTTAPVVVGHGYVPLKERDLSHQRRAASIIMRTGNNEAIQCGAAGFPKPTVIWYRIRDTEDESKLLDSNRGAPLANGPHIEVDGAELRLKNVTYDERGYYLCIANNDHEPPLHIYILVRIKSHLAPLWPFLVLLGEVAVLAVILGLCEWHRRKTSKDEEGEDSAKSAIRAQNSAKRADNANVGGSQIRQRQGAAAGKG